MGKKKTKKKKVAKKKKVLKKKLDVTIKRLSAVRTLSQMLPSGTESGKEFARIVDLLLFRQARRAGEKFTILDDAAGDYHGLDSFGGDYFRKHGTTGYQYKFYPSPLSTNHRSDIEKSLKKTAANQKSLNLKRWILVTPEDLTESATRRGGGDVTWFEGLRKKLHLKFELEHFGHTKLMGLFLEYPVICLFYYPEFIPHGTTRSKSIQDIRKRYDSNLCALYQRIEFVGMSVYKQEATRGIPIEDIYIPLTAVPDGADEGREIEEQVNPLSFLEFGAHNIVLGDPGSGKSTLLRFLALAGLSTSLQKRYSAVADQRLPILVTLRRYADELKSRKNLSLIEYIQESVQGDFNLKSADLDFFEYYLETGQAILLFDGLDELPSVQYKRKIRNSIRALVTTYPGNTTVVTSRIVGYSSYARFDRKKFVHYRLTDLQLPEIEQFVRDWYRVRIENEQERNVNVNDLIRILRDEDHVAIRELARNPLLLTIIALVHRIDAVLPDERIVLYQKCTETLLNTWHTWKFRNLEVKNRGKEERRNRSRMEAIAEWMHSLGGGTKEHQRAVVPYKALKQFLTSHIVKVEGPLAGDKDAEDLADEFLEFVKERAGLLIEIGDQMFSFVHLTFQEYLASSHIITSGESKGAVAIWKKIEAHCPDDRWNEVIRLLVAGLKSDETQEFLISKMLRRAARHSSESRLLGGLWMDGIEPAERHKQEIFRKLLNSATKEVSTESIRGITSMLKSCYMKAHENTASMEAAFQSLFKSLSTNKEKMVLLLVASGMDWPHMKTSTLTGDFLSKKTEAVAIFNFLLGTKPRTQKVTSLTTKIELLWAIQNFLSLTSASSNFVSAMCQAITFRLRPSIRERRLFEEQMVLLSCGSLKSPFLHFNMHSALISYDDKSTLYTSAKQLAFSLDKLGPNSMSRSRVLEAALIKTLLPNRIHSGTKIKKPESLNLMWAARDWARERALSLGAQGVIASLEKEDSDLYKPLYARGGLGFRQRILATPDLHGSFLMLLCKVFALQPEAHWYQALRMTFLPNVLKHITIFDSASWKKVEAAFENGRQLSTDIYAAACQLILDSYFYMFKYYKSKNQSIFSNLARLTSKIEAPPLRIAHCIRDLAYGDKGRIDDLISMVNSDDPEYSGIFKTCLWRPTDEEHAKTLSKLSRRQKKNDKHPNKKKTKKKITNKQSRRH